MKTFVLEISNLYIAADCFSFLQNVKYRIERKKCLDYNSFSRHFNSKVAKSWAHLYCCAVNYRDIFWTFFFFFLIHRKYFFSLSFYDLSFQVGIWWEKEVNCFASIFGRQKKKQYDMTVYFVSLVVFYILIPFRMPNNSYATMLHIFLVIYNRL